MELAEATDTESCREDSFPFLSLPPELMLKVCDYLESYTVIHILGKVCTRLNRLVTEDLIWRTRIYNRWPGKRYPPVAVPENFDWKEACIDREAEYKAWKSPSTMFRRTDLNVSHACIDTVHINSKLDIIAFGCRDHSLSVYKLSEIPNESKLELNDIQSLQIFRENQAHQGWVWTVNTNDDQLLCSGGWDSVLRIWNLNGQCLQDYKCGSPVISSIMDGNEILAGTMHQKLVKVDVRSPDVEIKTVASQAFLCMQATQNWLITGHESKTINIFDRNTMKLHSMVNCKKFGYPKSMFLLGNMLYVGCRDGTVNLYEFNHSLGKLAFRETIQEADEKMAQNRGVIATYGSVLTANKDGLIKVWEPSSKPALINQYNLNSEICDMVYVDGIVSAGLSTGIVSLLRPAPNDTAA